MPKVEYPPPQWRDKSTYKEEKDDVPVRAVKFEVDNATTYIDKDGSDNLTLTDAVTGTKTLAQLGAGAGDVTGPAASTDNMIARHHSTTGKVIQDYTSNPPTISDTGDMNIDGDLDVENIVVSGTVDGVDIATRDHAKYTDAEAVTAVEAAGLTFAENKGITLDAALSADEKYSGIVEAGTAGATVDFGDLLYHDVTAGEWLLAKADVAATSKGKLGINVTVAQAGDGNPITVLLFGKVRSDADYAFTVDAPVFISAATAGDLTTTAPTGTTNFVVRIVGYGNTADELYFCPDNTYVELA